MHNDVCGYDVMLCSTVHCCACLAAYFTFLYCVYTIIVRPASVVCRFILINLIKLLAISVTINLVYNVMQSFVCISIYERAVL